jgi:hypothetical protein
LTTVEPATISGISPAEVSYRDARSSHLANHARAGRATRIQESVVPFLVEYMDIHGGRDRIRVHGSRRGGQFVNGKSRDAQSLIATSAFPRSWRTRASPVDPRLQRDRIVGRPRQDSFLRIDMTAGGRLSGPTLTLDFALAYLSKADAPTAQKIRDSLKHLPDDDDRGTRLTVRRSANWIRSGIQSTSRSAMPTHRKRLITQSSAEEYRWALRNLDAARQLAKCLP